jgi:AcrR family transcriptional regulator
MAINRQAPDRKRRIPRQTRANETVALILEATAQILERGGLGALTTNAVAERAGVSIGTLYQYFADKNAIMLALAKREMEASLADIARALQGEAEPSPEARIRAVVRVMLNAFGGRRRARKAVTQAILSMGATGEVMVPVLSFIATEGARVGRVPQPIFAALTREQVFVLSRSVMGTIRAAIMEEQPFVTSRAFEDELVRLLMAYLTATTAGASARAG